MKNQHRDPSTLFAKGRQPLHYAAPSKTERCISSGCPVAPATGALTGILPNLK